MLKNLNYISRVVEIGQVRMGGDEDIRVQSMTNTSTLDTEASYRQIMELYEAGCELVRLTARNIKEAENIGKIRSMLEKQGVSLPLAADIHFNPKIAERAAELVHKIRINPGNYLDQQHFLTKTYNKEIIHTDPDQIKEGILRLTKICRQNKTVIRVGVNHGSLSDRILMKYGNTPEGMVASAMEFLRICREDNFDDLVVSMKSSHVPAMIRASIGIVEAMKMEGMDYPLHLGVTEAGEGEDGRVRSAAGIGPLLEYGLGDTIRVSLTEDPVAEIPVARELVQIHKEKRKNRLQQQESYRHDNYKRREVGILGGNNPIVVIGTEKLAVNDLRLPDLIIENEGKLRDKKGNEYPYLAFSKAEDLEEILSNLNQEKENKILVLETNDGDLASIRKMFEMLNLKRSGTVVVVKLMYSESDHDRFLLRSSSDLSSLIMNSYGNGYWLENESGQCKLHPGQVFSVLQATSKRISGTDYISCPGCGRTEFNLQHILRQIKEHTHGLQNVKIAVMGCIVNGPGEMVDADYGYVGAGKGKITLYHHGLAVKENIPEEEALPQLLDLINATHQ